MSRVCCSGLADWANCSFSVAVSRFIFSLKGSQSVAAPVGVVEGRVGHDEVGPEVFVQVAMEAVGLLSAEVGVDASDGAVDLGESPGGVVGLLAVDGDVTEAGLLWMGRLFSRGCTPG